MRNHVFHVGKGGNMVMLVVHFTRPALVEAIQQ